MNGMRTAGRNPRWGGEGFEPQQWREANPTSSATYKISKKFLRGCGV